MTAEGFAAALAVYPGGVGPERLFTKEELLGYLEHGRRKCWATIQNMTEEAAGKRCAFERPEVTRVELMLYNMRHVQHHSGQLNLILRQRIDSAPRWVAKASPTLR